MKFTKIKISKGNRSKWYTIYAELDEGDNVSKCKNQVESIIDAWMDHTPKSAPVTPAKTTQNACFDCNKPCGTYKRCFTCNKKHKER